MSEVRRKLDKARSYIEENLSRRDLDPDDVAHNCGMSRSRLYELFRPLGGVTSYIQMRRAHRFRSLLSQPREARQNRGARLCLRFCEREPRQPDVSRNLCPTARPVSQAASGGRPTQGDPASALAPCQLRSMGLPPERPSGRFSCVSDARAEARPWLWTTAVVLALAHLVSAFDRHVLSLVLPSIKAELHLTDTQLGFLHGTAYALAYGIGIVPAGFLVDRHNRARILLFALVTWTLGTGLCALAETYPQFVVARIVVGLGQAPLVPVAISLIADTFDETRRGKPIALFTSAATFGRGMALFGGGLVLTALATTQGLAAPGLPTPWRTLLLISLMLNAAVVAVFLSARISDPPRHRGSHAERALLLRDIASRWRPYLAYFANAAATILLVQTMAAWTPTIFVRSFGLSVAETGVMLGIIVLCCGPAGNVVGGAILDRLSAEGETDAAARLAFWSLLCMVVAGTGFCLVESLHWAIALMAATTFFLGMATPASLTAIQRLTPSPLRGRVTATFVLGVTLCSLGVGPVLVGWLSDHVYPGAAGLRHAVLAVLLVVGSAGMLASLVAGRLERRTLDRDRRGSRARRYRVCPPMVSPSPDEIAELERALAIARAALEWSHLCLKLEAGLMRAGQRSSKGSPVMRLFPPSLLAALTGGAALLAATTITEAGPTAGFLDLTRPACFSRTYTAEHLAKHPRQTVREIAFVYRANELYDGSKQANWSTEGSTGYLGASIALHLRHDDVTKMVGAGCRGGAGETLTCAIDEDGGTITLRPAKAGVLMTFQSGIVFAPSTGHLNADDRNEILIDGAEDREFLLQPARGGLCDSRFTVPDNSEWK